MDKVFHRLIDIGLIGVGGLIVTCTASAVVYFSANAIHSAAKAAIDNKWRLNHPRLMMYSDGQKFDKIEDLLHAYKNGRVHYPIIISNPSPYIYDSVHKMKIESNKSKDDSAIS